jgi:hypothetical protein
VDCSKKGDEIFAQRMNWLWTTTISKSPQIMSYSSIEKWKSTTRHYFKVKVEMQVERERK